MLAITIFKKRKERILDLIVMPLYTRVYDIYIYMFIMINYIIKISFPSVERNH